MKKSNAKRERFERVASRRVERVIESIRSLAKCSNTNNYQYDSGDIQKMTKAIKDELRILEVLYRKNLKDRNNTFNF